ncbi:MAG: hypothetical protein HQ568_08275 [Calditrichaeota bacterium]|nr:hypothetical protein [Calditrichota bacterium]
MTTTTKKLLYWSPRVLCILYAAFISLFALDVFEDGFNGLETLIALAMHMIPTAFIVIVIIVTWRWEWVGGILFNGLAVFYIVWAWGKFPLATYIAISGPMFLAGILFLINWKYRSELRDR